MPTAAPRPCASQGCQSYAKHGSRYCAIHAAAYQPAQRLPDTRPSRSERGYDRAWKRLRHYVLSKHPLCVVCGNPATEVDHIKRLTRGGTNSLDNLQSLCKSCHSRKTARERMAP